MKKKLVLHICCAADQSWVVKTLNPDYDLHCFFCNPNIYPAEEYTKRLDDVKKVSRMVQVPLTEDSSNPEAWEKAVLGFEHTPEGGERCMRCFLLRLRKTALFCKELGWPAFTTVMSISPHKSIAMLDAAGAAAAKEYNVLYEPFNFKKNNGFLNSIRLSRELDLYRQDYCGCSLSRIERDNRSHNKK